MFPGPLDGSILGRGRKAGIWDLETVDIREFARDKHRTVDDTPAGGGPGMVMKADVLAAALDATRTTSPSGPSLLMSPRGAPLSQSRVKELAGGSGVTLVCGRFEGIDERVIEARGLEEVSIGDFVMTGGEIAAMAIIDAAVRLLPGVVGAAESIRDESFEGDLLEYPHYTRPQSFEGREIPAVLTSGDHAKVDAWRREQAERITKKRRPDLWARYEQRLVGSAKDEQSD
jgi:tRNA (guanine37-N1)-methyltransferase